MKELRNKWDSELVLESLEDAKRYFTQTEKVLSELDEEIKYEEQADNLEYAKELKKLNEVILEYNGEIEEAKSLEELAEVLNRYTDTLGNGTEYYVYDIFKN